MLAVNKAVQRLSADLVTMVHAGDVTVSEYDISNKLILIGMNLDMDYVATEDVVHRMALNLEEECIDS